MAWKGSQELTESEDSPELQDDENGLRVIIRKRGPLQRCIDQRPQRGQAVSGWPNMKVQLVTVTNNGDESGTIVITLVPQGLYAPSPDEAAESIMEVEWMEVQKPLAQHPDFAGEAPGGLAPSDIAAVEKAISEGTALPDLGPLVEKYYIRRRRGQESYVEYAPLARQTTYHAAKPTTGQCGTISDPPSEIKVSGYQYLKTADRALKQARKWERIQEWTGAREIDEDIYANGKA